MVLLFVEGEGSVLPEYIEFNSEGELQAFLINLANDYYDNNLTQIDKFLDLDQENLTIGGIRVRRV